MDVALTHPASLHLARAAASLAPNLLVSQLVPSNSGIRARNASRIGGNSGAARYSLCLAAALVCEYPRRSRRNARRVMRPSSFQQDQSIWTLLDLPPGAPKAEIKKKFKRFVRTEHPDVKGDPDPEAATRFSKIMETYKQIMDTDEDRFWLDAYCAKVEAIEASREAKWKARQAWRADQISLEKLRAEQGKSGAMPPPSREEQRAYQEARTEYEQARRQAARVVINGVAADLDAKKTEVTQDVWVKLFGFVVGLLAVVGLLSNSVGSAWSSKKNGSLTNEISRVEARRIGCTSWDAAQEDDFCSN